MKRFICLSFLCCLSCWNCAILENSIDNATERPIPINPVLYSASDSIKLFNAKSVIQRSPEYILSSFVVEKEGAYYLEITKEEMDLFGITDTDYKRFINTMSGLKPIR